MERAELLPKVGGMLPLLSGNWRINRLDSSCWSVEIFNAEDLNERIYVSENYARKGMLRLSYSGTSCEINVGQDRSSKGIAGDIERRLLPKARNERVVNRRKEDEYKSGEENRKNISSMLKSIDQSIRNQWGNNYHTFISEILGGSFTVNNENRIVVERADLSLKAFVRILLILKEEQD